MQHFFVFYSPWYAYLAHAQLLRRRGSSSQKEHVTVLGHIVPRVAARHKQRQHNGARQPHGTADASVTSLDSCFIAFRAGLQQQLCCEVTEEVAIGTTCAHARVCVHARERLDSTHTSTKP